MRPQILTQNGTYVICQNYHYDNVNYKENCIAMFKINGVVNNPTPRDSALNTTGSEADAYGWTFKANPKWVLRQIYSNEKVY